MFTEDQVEALLQFEGIEEKVARLKLDFKEKEAQLMDISNADFLGLAILTPSIELARASGSISLMEEMALNQKARKLSKGGHFLQTDPVVYAMKFLINNFENWRDVFYVFLAELLAETAKLDELEVMEGHSERVNDFEFEKNLFHAPYIFVQYLCTFFVNDVSQATIAKKVSQMEYEKILEMGRKLKIDHYLIFKGFCQTFTVR